MSIGAHLQRSDSPLVSVIIPAFNEESYISRAIQSVLDQTYTHFELIVVNDGSADGTEEVIQTFQDPRITSVTQDNKGVSAARNAGLARSRGAYVALLDADDIWYPNRLERQLTYARDEGVRAVFSWADAIDDDSRIIDPSKVSAWFNRTCSSQAEMMRTFFAIGNFLCVSTALIERALLAAVGWFCLTSIQVQDFDLWQRIVKKTRIAILPEKLVGYRVHDNVANLTYDPANVPRIQFELQQIYRVMFDEMPDALFREAFATRSRQTQVAQTGNLELEQAFLYLEHTEPYIRHIGMERLYLLLQNQTIANVARGAYGFTLPDFFALTRAAPAQVDVIEALKARLAEREEAVRWNDEQRQYWQRIAEERAAAAKGPHQ